MNDVGAAYLANHRFAVLFTCVAAASQGLGGLLAVLGMGDYGESVAHLMSFSTGVMVYLSFMDIMVDTTEKIGEYSSIAFFVGFALFLLLEVALPEVEGTQVVELFGLGWSLSLSTEGEQASTAEDKGTDTDKERLGLHRRAGKASDDAPPDLSMARRSAGSPARTRPVPSSPPKSASVASLRKAQAVASSPPPSQKRKAFEEEGEQAVTDRRKRRVAFSGLMVMISISLHNIPEGVAVYLTCLKGVESGLPLAIAMSLHNIPEGMAVAGPLYAATKSKTKAVLAATVSGGFEVLGCLLVQLFFDRITPFFLEFMLSLVAGIMVGLGARPLACDTTELRSTPLPSPPLRSVALSLPCSNPSEPLRTPLLCLACAALIELLPSCLEVLKPVPMGCSCAGGMVFMFISKSLSNQLIEALK